MADIDEDLLAALNTAFVFRSRPISLPADLRPTWRIGLLVLMLSKCCRQQKSSLTRLHVLNWAVRSEPNMESLLALLANELTPDSLIVRFEPAFNRAIDFAIGEGLIQRVDGARIELTTAGKSFAKEIVEKADLYSNEKRLLDLVRLRASEGLVDQIFGGR